MDTVSMINLVMWSFILWHYVIKPRMIKRQYYLQLYQHPDFKTLKKTERFVYKLYKDNKAYILSRQVCKKLGKNRRDFIYGEIEFFPFVSILMKVNPHAEDIFYDLGCGSGKAALTTALCFDLKKVCGIELLPELYTLAKNQIHKAKELSPHQKRLECLQFYNHNFLDYDFTEATIVYVNATCFSEPLWDDLQKKLRSLKTGSRIILGGKTIQDQSFRMISTSKELMHWGMNSITIYTRC